MLKTLFKWLLKGGGLNVKKANGEWVIKGIASLPSVIYGNDVCNGNKLISLKKIMTS